MNKLIHESSPYLKQHANNPVDWYPWGEEAFDKAKSENKPVFLSVGYSTCHWCHVMAHESFEDGAVADLLNAHFVSVKVDKEQRPDIDNIYMRACQAMTGSGGWPTSLFLTPEKKPFFAGTYFHKPHFQNLLSTVAQKWRVESDEILKGAEEITSFLAKEDTLEPSNDIPFEQAVEMFTRSFDREYGGFGSAPKFPSPHNLMFLLYTKPELAEKTLVQMYKGGIFDHIGYGFSRYSTDRHWLVPHFEKMLYDNALLTLAYLLAYEVTQNPLYKEVAIKTLDYIGREMTDRSGGFFSAQDADSDGEEGKYYVFTPDEIVRVLGEDDGHKFNAYFDITQKGNFERKSIPNIIHNTEVWGSIDNLLDKVYNYRKGREQLHIDNKILTSWNALMIAAYACAYRILGDETYLAAAEQSAKLIEAAADAETLYTTPEKVDEGFLDDYAFYTFALINLHQATQNQSYLDRALQLTNKTIADFYDAQNGGFFFSGVHNERMIANPKETFDNAIPSGNSMMAYTLDRLAKLTHDERLYQLRDRQRAFMNGHAAQYPIGFGFYLYSCLPTVDIVCVPVGEERHAVKSNWVFREMHSPAYPAINHKTTYYVCEGNTCKPPSNTL